MKTNNVAVIVSESTKFPLDAGERKTNVFVIGGKGNEIKGSRIFVFGAGNNVSDSDSVLLGSNIKAGGKKRIFVWSPNNDNFEPQHSGSFYVNSKNGI